MFGKKGSPRLAPVAAAGAVCLVVAACGGGAKHQAASAATTTSLPAATTTTSSTTASTTTTSTAATSTTSTTPAAVARCTSADAKVTFAVQAPGAAQPPNRIRVLVTFTNSSSSPCTVDGFAGIGAGLGTSGTDSIPVNRVQIPGAPGPVTVAPGANAYAGAEWTSQASCSQVRSFELTPPNSSSSASVRVVAPNGAKVPLYLCPEGIDLGPFEATTTGVVAFPDSTGAAGPPVCTAADLSGTFTPVLGSQGAGQLTGRIVLTNTTGAPCLVGGYLGLQLIGATGSPLPTNVVQAAGNASSITLQPTAAVSAAARFSPDIAGPGDAQTGPCQPTATSTRVSLPDEAGYIVASGPGTPVCERGTLDLTPLQQGSTAGAP